VYRVDVTLRIPAIRTSNGQRIGLGHGGTVAERGTATAVAPDGWLVTAAHLVDPDPRTLARIGYQRWQAAQGVAVSDADAHAWAIDAGAEAVGARVLGIRVSQADPGTGFFETRRWTGVVERTAANADLSLIRIGAPGAPALPLEDAVSLGTPVVTIGYGRGSAWDKPNRSEGEPAVRRGRLERTGILSGPRRKATVVSTDIQRGDSGGPAVDADGNVRGIVVLRGEGGGIIEQAAAVRRLLEEEGLDSPPAPPARRTGAAWPPCGGSTCPPPSASSPRRCGPSRTTRWRTPRPCASRTSPWPATRSRANAAGTCCWPWESSPRSPGSRARHAWRGSRGPASTGGSESPLQNEMGADTDASVGRPAAPITLKRAGALPAGVLS